MSADDGTGFAELLERASEKANAPVDPVVAARSRRRRRGGWAIFALVLLLLVAIAGTLLNAVLVAPTDAATAQLVEPEVPVPAPVTFALPPTGAAAVGLTGAEEFPGTAGADGVLASSGSTDPLPVGSITKLVTALVILKARPIPAGENGPTITFSEADSDLYDDYYVRGATVQPMDEGSSVSERDALELMLVVSASNYADVVSRWAYGSRSAFLAATRDWLAENGLGGTTIVEPTGLDPGNVSTTKDLLALGRIVMADPVLSELVGITDLQVPGFDSIRNSNELLGSEGINGIKTGTLPEAGSCLLFSATVDVGLDAPVSVIGVVLGAQDDPAVNTAVLNLLESVKSGFHEVPLVEAGDVLGEYTTPWGDTAPLIAAESASVLTWSDTPIVPSVTTEPVDTGSPGTEVGRLTFTAGARTATVPLILDGTISGPDRWWRLTHAAELLFD